MSDLGKNMKLNAVYTDSVIALHNLKSRIKEWKNNIQETENSHSIQNNAQRRFDNLRSKFTTHAKSENVSNYSHIFRSKSRMELIALSGAVCGIEFCYSAETAFVSPILLSLGLNVTFMTMIWCLSPILGFFITPLLGSMSDTCRSRFGRRRPFIIALSVGILLGLLLVPNGKAIGLALGDYPYGDEYTAKEKQVNETANQDLVANSRTAEARNTTPEYGHSWNRSVYLFTYQRHTSAESIDDINLQTEDNGNTKSNSNATEIGNSQNHTSEEHLPDVQPGLKLNNQSLSDGSPAQHWGLLFTSLGSILLDFCCDACQSPSRTYLLDVTIPSDHQKGLSTFTMMAGFGGCMGYLMGAINWDQTFLGIFVGGHVRAVFLIVTVMFVLCVCVTINSFPEIPLNLLQSPFSVSEYPKLEVGEYLVLEKPKDEHSILSEDVAQYGATREIPPQHNSTVNSNYSQHNTTEDNNFSSSKPASVGEISSECSEPTLKQYLISIFHMPKSLVILCLTNLFCWMALISYSLYFTNFVGESVFNGNPRAPAGSLAHNLYEDGVRFGCWGMAVFSISCSVYSCCIRKFVEKFGAKSTYIGGQVTHALGMLAMALCPQRAAVIIFSTTSGIMYGTIFTMPYFLMSHYHCTQRFSKDPSSVSSSVRGIGTDVALISSMVFLAQFLLSLSMGSIVSVVGSSAATVWASSLFAFTAAVCATQVLYLDL